MDPKNKKQKEEPSPSWERDPFPQPRTFPAGWDLSEYSNEQLTEDDWTPPNRKERGPEDEWK